MPKVSVIIPIYGVEKYIERCAVSLFEQTLDDIEYIFVDDCSPDCSIEILESIIEKYRLRLTTEKKKVRIERMPTNSGLTAVRRHGVQLATGDYIIHCDSDDWTSSTMLEEMYSKAISNNLDIVICDYYRSDGTFNISCPSIRANVSEDTDFLSILFLGKVSTSVWNKLVKRELYFQREVIPPVCNMWEDFVYVVQLFYYAKGIGYIEKPFYFYYYNQSSICNSAIESRIEQIMRNSHIILTFLNEKKIRERYDNELVYFKYYCRSELDMYTNNAKYLNLWRLIYPEINLRFYFCSCISFRDKVKFFSIYFGIYPRIVGILHKLNYGKNN